MRKISIVLIVSILLSTFPLSGFSAFEDEGYIVKLRHTDDSVSLLSSDPLEAIVPDKGIYRLESGAALADLIGTGLVEYYEQDCMAVLMDIPSDTLYSQQWNIPAVNADAAWDNGLDGHGVRLAVIDSGINRSHEDLAAASIADGVNIINGGTDVSDKLGHGTFIAGIIAAVRDNSIGVAGITDKVEIVPIKCFSDSKETSASYIISGIYSAVDDYDCDVINLSLGIEKNMELLREAINYAVGSGVIVVSAAGNSGGSEFVYPAAYDNVICVGSVDNEGITSAFSNHNETVFAVAPGEGIISLGTGNNVYSKGSGTSYSVPHVSAMAAVAKCVDPNITVYEMQSALMETSVDLGEQGRDDYYGYGLVDFAEFIAYLQTLNRYSDVRGHWAESYIMDVTENDLCNGVSETEFGPDLNMSRAMAVTVLARLWGGDLSGFDRSFSDVEPGLWYSRAVSWGAEAGIVYGLSDNEFGPDSYVSREQMATFLYRFAVQLGFCGEFNGENSLGNFADAESVSSWAIDAVNWAVSAGLMNGKTAETLLPGGNITRADAAALISRFLYIYC